MFNVLNRPKTCRPEIDGTQTKTDTIANKQVCRDLPKSKEIAKNKACNQYNWTDEDSGVLYFCRNPDRGEGTCVNKNKKGIGLCSNSSSIMSMYMVNSQIGEAVIFLPQRL